MSEIDTNILRNGQLVVATLEQSGDIISAGGVIDATAIVETENGPQKCVMTYSVGGGGGGGGSQNQAIIASFTGSAAYLSSKQQVKYSDGAFEIEVHFKTGSSFENYLGVTWSNSVGPGFYLDSTGALTAVIAENVTITKSGLETNSEYWAKIVCPNTAGATCTLYFKEEGGEYETVGTATLVTPVTDKTFVVGALLDWSPVAYFNGEVYLNDLTVKVNGNVVLNGKYYEEVFTNNGGVIIVAYDTKNYANLTNKPQVNGVTLSGNKSSADLHLQGATTITTLTTTSVELASNTIYNGGELASVTLTLPNSIPADFICQVEFTSGTTETTFTAPATLYFNGDACESGVFTPIASKRYCILIITDGVNPLGFVYEK